MPWPVASVVIPVLNWLPVVALSSQSVLPSSAFVVVEQSMLPPFDGVANELVVAAPNPSSSRSS